MKKMYASIAIIFVIAGTTFYMWHRVTDTVALCAETRRLHSTPATEERYMRFERVYGNEKWFKECVK